jgi:N-acetylmuramoyl-L-alanine amidase
MHFINKYTTTLTKLIGLVVFSLIASSFCYGNDSGPEAYKLKKVVVDAGHGGKDSGAVGKKSLEKDIVLSVALKVGGYIEQSFPDVEVIYTRKEDVFVPLDERSKIANESGADLFISIHCNANPSRVPYGAETYVMGLHKSEGNLDVAMRENAVIAYEEDYSSKYEGYDPNSAESFIIFSLMQNTFLDQSLNMASLVQDEFRERARRRDRGVKQAGFIVLWKTSMPSVLVELGFLSNPKEEDYLITEEGQTYLASAVFRAFRSYKEQIEQRSSFAAENSFDSSLSQGSNQVSSTISASWNENPEHKEATFANGISYKVQITASRNRVATNDPFFKNIKEVEEFPVDDMYKYLVGNEKTYTAISAVCDQVRELFPDAFIIAFQDGKPIPLSKAKQLSKN